MRQGEITDPPAVRDVINNMIEDQKRVQQKRIQLLDTIKYDHIPLMPTDNKNPYLSEISRQWRVGCCPIRLATACWWGLSLILYLLQIPINLTNPEQIWL